MTASVWGPNASPFSRPLKNLKYDFGAIGDGVANDYDKVLAAIAYAKLNNCPLEGNPEDNYYVGTFPDAGQYKFTIDFPLLFESNNCKFSATTNLNVAAVNQQAIFVISDTDNVIFGDIQFEGTAVQRPPSAQKGLKGISIYNRTAASKNIKIGKVTARLCETAVSIATDDPALYRHAGVTIDAIYAREGYYGFNCPNNGDAVTVGLISTYDMVRSYFVYGVTGQVVNEIYSENHFTFNDVDIKCYTRDTKNIKILKYTAVNDLALTPSITLDHENDTDNTTISDVEINVNIAKSSAANPSIIFVAYTAAGAVKPTTGCQWKNISILGLSNSSIPVQLSSVVAGNNPSRIFLDKQLLKGLTDYKRFIVSDGPFSFHGMSDATGGMTIELNVSEYRLIPAYGRLTVWAANDGAGSNVNYIIRDYWVDFVVASNGVVTLGAATVITTRLVDPGAFGPTITVAGSGAGVYDLLVTVANYTGANRLCRAKFEPLGYFI